jgi:hypothetical protein
LVAKTDIKNDRDENKRTNHADVEKPTFRRRNVNRAVILNGKRLARQSIGRLQTRKGKHSGQYQGTNEEGYR